MKLIPENFKELLADETRAMAYLATIMPDGSPQVTPIWFNTEGEYILINSAQGRVKDRNMRARSRVALVIADPKNIYRYIQVRGRVVEITSEGANDHIDRLSMKYHGRPYDGPKVGRTTYKIQPEKANTMG